MLTKHVFAIIMFALDLRVEFRASKTVLSNRYPTTSSNTPPQPPSPVVFLLTVLMWVLYCNSSLFVHRRFYMWRLFCHCLFLGSPFWGTSGKLYSVIMAFSGKLHTFTKQAVSRTRHDYLKSHIGCILL